MSTVRITAGGFVFRARLETAAAPRSCARFQSLLPYRQRLIHVRWSGEACWIPLGDLDLGLGPENATSYPAPGQILLAYGAVAFASKAGPLAGNHFLSVTEGLEQLRPLGERTLWQGAQEILFEAA